MGKFFWFPAGLSSMYLYQNMTHDQLVIVAGMGTGLIVGLTIIAVMALMRQSERAYVRQVSDSNVALAARVNELEAERDNAMERLSRLNGDRMGKRRRASMRRKAA